MTATPTARLELMHALYPQNSVGVAAWYILHVFTLRDSEHLVIFEASMLGLNRQLDVTMLKFRMTYVCMVVVPSNRKDGDSKRSFTCRPAVVAYNVM